jgi:hypothetical protein
MRILPSFPADAARGRCLVDASTSTGACVDLGISVDQIPKGARNSRLVVSEGAIRGIAAHFGMIDESIHAEARDRVIELVAELTLANEKIAALAAAVRVLGIEPVLPEAPAAEAPKRKKKPEPAIDSPDGAA